MKGRCVWRGEGGGGQETLMMVNPGVGGMFITLGDDCELKVYDVSVNKLYCDLILFHVSCA